MKLQVFVADRAVASLQTSDNFQYHLSYLDETDPQDFVSLQMPVRKVNWNWPALHPFFQSGWPQDDVMTALQERLGTSLAVNPLRMLEVAANQLPGRVRVSRSEKPRARLALPDRRALLRRRSSREALLTLMDELASDCVPERSPVTRSQETRPLYRKATILTERHLVKATSAQQPFAALNEHLCMRVAAATGYSACQGEVSEDGQLLLMERCDFDTGSGQYQGYEEFCGLLGLHPDHRYDSSWERLARLTGDYVMPIGLRRAKEQLAVTLLLSLVLGNADCHARSMGFVYSNFNDVQLAPICGMMTTSVYDAEVQRPTALHLDGAKTWNPGKGLWRYLQQHLGVENARQRELVDLVCTSVSERVADVTQHITHTPGFAELGRSMLRHWSDGILRLSERLTLPVPDISEISRVQECAELEANPATGDATAPASHKKKRGAASPASAADNAEQLKLLFE